MTRMAAGGRGVARLGDGCVLFVPGGSPGDRVRLKKIERKRRYCVALEWELEAASIDREPAACPIANACGGCDWMGLKPEAQRRWKREIVHDALRRVGKLTPEVLPTISAGPSLRYRSRARFHVAPGGVLGFKRARSEEVIPVEDCAVCTEAVNKHLRKLQLSSAPSLEGWTTAEIRSFDDSKASLHLVSTNRQVTLSSVHKTQLASTYQVSTNSSTDFPRDELPALEDVPGSIRPSASPADFTQVNWFINRALIQTLIHGVQRHRIQSFLDLYCGVGNFSFPLLQRGLVGQSFESNRSAITSAQRTAASYGLEGSTFEATPVTAALKRLVKEKRRFDLVIIDPPRAGAKDAVQYVVRLAPRHVFYVACDPVTFARDLSSFEKHGYAASEVQPYDMFPQTHHVETSAWLTSPTESA